MNKVEIKVEEREAAGKKNKVLRRQGLVPAVVYGRKFKPTAISINLKEFIKQVEHSESGHNLIFSLKLGARHVPVITQDIHRDSISDQIIHLDFMHINMDEKIKAHIPVELVGVPIGVKDSGGILVHGLHDVEVECLPGDIPKKFEVDVSALEIGRTLMVSDLNKSDKVKILSSANEMIATVSAPTKEEEVAPAVPVPGAEGAVTAEGEAAAPTVAAGAPGAPAQAEAAKPAAKKEPAPQK